MTLLSNASHTLLPRTSSPKARSTSIAPYRLLFATDRASLSRHKIQFGALPAYFGPFNHATLYSDFNDGASNHEALSRFNDVLYWAQQHKRVLRKNGLLAPLTLRSVVASIGAWLAAWFQLRQTTLSTKTFSDTPFGNIDYSGLTIQRLMLSRTNKDVLIHVTDPGVGNGEGHDRSILVTQHHGILIGPNNGSLGVALTTLRQRKEHYELYPIDLSKVEQFEKLRYSNPHYALPESFHARDAFAVVGGALAAGVPAAMFADKARMKQGYTEVQTEFSNNIHPLALKPGESTSFQACVDKTFGNLKTNLTLQQSNVKDGLKDLIQAQAAFKITNPINGKELIATAATAFSQVKVGAPLLYLGSTYSSKPGALQGENCRFVELALNMANISEALGIINPEIGASAVPLTIERVR